MAIGKSGRVVIDLDPRKKAEIYEALSQRGLSLKSWFLEQVTRDLLEMPRKRGVMRPTRNSRKRT